MFQLFIVLFYFLNHSQLIFYMLYDILCNYITLITNFKNFFKQLFIIEYHHKNIIILNYQIGESFIEKSFQNSYFHKKKKKKCLLEEKF